MNIRNNIETTRVVNSKINLSILKSCPKQYTHKARGFSLLTLVCRQLSLQLILAAPSYPRPLKLQKGTTCVQ